MYTAIKFQMIMLVLFIEILIKFPQISLPLSVVIYKWCAKIIPSHARVF